MREYAVTYDEIGNTLSYRDGISFTWKKGRQLATFTQGQTSASYDYNESGIRNKKTVNGVTTTYQLAGSMIVSENRNGNIIQYYYNEAGSVIGLRYNGNDYFFRRTVNGDIIAILNTSGEVVVTYEYDPWGNILSTSGSMASTLGVANPFRYRGYYYDNESGLYYLQTRYYDAAIGRFINADGYTSTGQGFLGNNMYAYCLNNPISFADYDGKDAILLLDMGSGRFDFGHFGFLFQGEKGNWYHYYWGSSAMEQSDGKIKALFSKTEPREVISLYASNDFSLDGINQNSGYGFYDEMIYIPGDFSSIFSQVDSGESYQALINNCTQHSFKLLANCGTVLSSDFEYVSSITLPLTAFTLFKKRYERIQNRTKCGSSGIKNRYDCIK